MTHEKCHTFGNVLGIRYCISNCSVSYHSSIRHMKDVILLVSYYVLGIVLAIVVRPIIPH